jgi:MFS family permease
MSVTVVAFQSLGVGTVMPAVARDLGGLGRYGWAFSAFMLASLIGSVAAGQDADRAGPVRAYAAAVVAFAGGSVLAAVASSWDMLLAGRALEGLGAGALVVVTYASASGAYPPAMYGRMLALMSSAWVLPSLAGPAVAGLVADHTTWRWVFVLLLPFLPVAVAVALPGLRALTRPDAAAPGRRLPQALALAASGCSSPASRPTGCRCWRSSPPAGSRSRRRRCARCFRPGR